MALRPFSVVPRDTREWAEWCRLQFIQADTITAGAAGTAALADNAVTNAKLRDSAALSVIGRPVNSAGDPSDMSAASDGDVMRRSGAAIGFGQISTSIVIEGANLYYTDERAQDAVGAILTDSARIDFTYTDAAPTITADLIADSVSNTYLANMADSTIKGRASGAGTGDPTDLSAAQVLAILGLTGLVPVPGKYTPTLTGVINVAASGALECQYVRIGSMVIVSGRLTVDPTAVGATELGISLPIASNFGAVEDCGGVACANASAGLCAAIVADTVNDRATMVWVQNDAANRAMSIFFMYEVI